MPYILLAEDDVSLIDIYKKKLETAGFAVRIAVDSKAVFQELSREKPILLILDIVLPGLNGWEILSELKRREDLADVKVMILSSLGQKEEVEKGLELGALKYLIKTQFKPSEIVEKVREILRDNCH